MDHHDPDRVARLLLESASTLANACHAKGIVVDIDALPPLHAVPPDTLLVVREDTEEERIEPLRETARAVLKVPSVRLDRMGQMRLAAIIALSSRVLDLDDLAVFLAGAQGRAADTLTVMRVGTDYELLDAEDQPGIGEHIKREVFHRVLTVALQLGQYGREGRPIGTLLVVGDHRKVLEQSEQLILNPFKGYPESDRNVLDERMFETLREFSALDGAFVVRGTGVVEAAGAHLRAALAEGLPKGLGARHAAAAGITASTRSVAITVSESGGVVRVWRAGRLVATFEPGSG